MSPLYTIAMLGACPFPTSQGSQVLIRQLCDALAERGHTVHLVTYHTREQTIEPPPAWTIHRVPRLLRDSKLGSGPSWGKVMLDFLLLLKAAWVVWRVQPDVIHAHNYEALIIGWIVGILSRRPLVYHSHNVMAAELPTYFRRRWQRWVARQLAKVFDHQLPKRADVCIALSSEAVNFFGQCGVEKNRIRLVPPGIKFDETSASDSEAFRRKHGLGDAPVAIYCGNLDQYQRLEALLVSFQRVQDAMPAAKLVIASHGPRSSFEELVASIDTADGVHFVHCQSFADTQAALAAADVAICPRMACFGFPIKLLNYLAAGKAVVVARGSAKGITHLENGFVVDDENESLAQGVLTLLQDQELRSQLADAALATIEGHYQWPQLVRQVERCYAQLIPFARSKPMYRRGRASSGTQQAKARAWPATD